MQNQGEPEKVFEIGAEGGGISIFRERSRCLHYFRSPIPFLFFVI